MWKRWCLWEKLGWPAVQPFSPSEAIARSNFSQRLLCFGVFTHDLNGTMRRTGGRIAGLLLFVLAAFIASASVLTLLGHLEPRPSPIGIALLVLAAMIIPWLAAQKRRLSITTASAALRADSAESAVCGYLALIALVGLVVSAVWKVSWADPVAALALLPLIVREGWEARKGKPCCH